MNLFKKTRPSWGVLLLGALADRDRSAASGPPAEFPEQWRAPGVPGHCVRSVAADGALVPCRASRVSDRSFKTHTDILTTQAENRTNSRGDIAGSNQMGHGDRQRPTSVRNASSERSRSVLMSSCTSAADDGTSDSTSTRSAGLMW